MHTLLASLLLLVSSVIPAPKKVTPLNVEYRSDHPLDAETISVTTDTVGIDSPEGYTLRITPEGISVAARSNAGVYYAMQTLRQLVRPAATGFVADCMVIEDEPRFPYRGVMFDVSRHFFPKETIKKHIDILSRYKINRVHLHLTDAAGWRMEISGYPRLTQMAAWRPQPLWETWWKSGRRYVEEGDSSAYGGYFTRSDLREIVEYAARRHVTVVPEIEFPGHSEEVLAAYPELGCSGLPYSHSDFCAGNEDTYEFIERVLDEVMDVFPSEYIHIGGDEAGKESWKNCSKCQALMEREGLKDVDELQNYMMNRVAAYLATKGRKAIGWDEVLQGAGESGGFAVMSWRGEQGGIAAARAHREVIMTPGEYCYLNRYQDAPLSHLKAMGGYVPLKKVYGYDPVPAVLTPQEGEWIRGVQGNLWAEFIPDDAALDYFMYPRMLAIAEVGWTDPERKDWNSFHANALRENGSLSRNGVGCFDLSEEVGARPESLMPAEHLARGCKVIYNAPYHKAYPAAGDTTLTDGLMGDWTYDDGRWQGFISRDRLDATVDLGKRMPISEIYASFMQSVNVEIYTPVDVEISVSDDGEEFTPLYSMQQDIDMDCRADFRKIGWSGNATARYVRYRAHSSSEHGGWIFTDEIIVH